MKACFTIEPSVRSNNYNHLNYNREVIEFIKDLDPSLIPKGQFTLNDKEYQYYTEIPRINKFREETGNIENYLEIVCYRI